MSSDTLISPEEQLDIKVTDIPIRNIWHMLLYAWDEPPNSRNSIKQDEELAPTLDTLLCLILIRLIQQRFRIGLGRSYLDDNHIIRGIRGQVNFGESLKNNLFYKGQTFCQFQEFSANVPKNQIVRTTLQRMVHLGRFGHDRSYSQDVCQRLRRASMSMDGVNMVELSLDFIDRQHLGRNDKDYRIMLAICRLLLQKYMPVSNEGRLSLTSIDTFGFLMHNIYELFVANFFKHHLLDWKVSPQKIFRWNELSKNQYLPIMRPDLVLEEKSTKRTLVLDTKYSRQTVKNQFGDEKFQSSHLYQMYAYLKTQEEMSELHRISSGILLYPKSGLNKIDTCIELPNHSIYISCIDLSDPWHEIERNLLEMIRVY